MIWMAIIKMFRMCSFEDLKNGSVPNEDFALKVSS